ncbi:hypothetical protein VPAL9027_01752 [Vibrio palustris]|uniref:Uncharacterized protein n=1 Tax=Vibrio palustris TaxID=1918946 RepID=A0A1R4B4C4_9VIBR|nr:hypothetical protein VPAL9027_01752 [Vibrio palustris]
MSLLINNTYRFQHPKTSPTHTVRVIEKLKHHLSVNTHNILLNHTFVYGKLKVPNNQ